MDKTEIKEYNETIRRMLEHEDEIRNQRTNWFLVIQGLLINGMLMLLTNKDFKCSGIIIFVLLVIGVFVSFSFLWAAYLSSKASKEGKIYWQNYMKANHVDINDFPPICLLAREKYDENQNYIKRETDYFLPYICLPFFFMCIELLLLLINLNMCICSIMRCCFEQ